MNRQQMNKQLTLAMLALVLISMGAIAQEENKLEVSVDTKVMSRCVWRGLVLNDELVSQSSVTAGIGGFSINTFVNVDLTNSNGTKLKINELDFTADYSFSHDKFNISLGLINYTFPNTEYDQIREIYAAVHVETMLNPSVTVNQDVYLIEGTYISFAVAEAVEIPATPLSLEFSAALGYGSSNHNTFYYGYEEAGLTDLQVGTNLGYNVSANLSLSSSLTYAMYLTEGIKDIFGEHAGMVFGVGAAYNF